MEESGALNYRLGLSYYGDEQLYKSQLGSFESMTLDPALHETHQAWKNQDLKSLEKCVRKIKMGASSIAAPKLQIAAEKLEEVITKGQTGVPLDKAYGNFLAEARYVKMSISKITENTMNLNGVEGMVKDYNKKSAPSDQIVLTKLNTTGAKRGSVDVGGDPEVKCGGCTLV
jgi:HPt (histidine-containing phosphotransfer) domain-containing protein